MTLHLLVWLAWGGGFVAGGACGVVAGHLYLRRRTRKTKP